MACAERDGGTDRGCGNARDDPRRSSRANDPLAAELGLADLLASSPQTTATLAQATGTDSDALARLLRALAHCALFALEGDDAWRLAPLGETLRTDAPGSCRPAARYWGLASIRAAWDRLDHSVRTGEPGFRHKDDADVRTIYENWKLPADLDAGGYMQDFVASLGKVWKPKWTPVRRRW